MGDAGTDDGALRVILDKLGDSKHLNREKGLTQLQDVLNNTGANIGGQFFSALKDGLKSLLASDVWERKLGGLIGCKAIVQGVPADAEFDQFCVDECKRLLEDPEVRVRQAVGDLLQALAGKLGVTVFDQCCDQILTSIYTHYDREGEGEKEGAGSQAAPELTDLLGALLKSTYAPQRIGEGDLRHGSEGWKCLETSMKAFQQLVEGVGVAVGPQITPALLQLLLRSVYHPNRFVRETTHFTTAALCGALGGERLEALGGELAPRLVDGLSDNWSQVRYAASTAARAFLLALPEASRGAFYGTLLPAMCMNRYYVAEGVRLYSQQSWQLVVGREGRQLVAAHIDKVVPYYVLQSKASNHAVREAACACIAELMEKVDREAVGRHVPLAVRALLLCFRDMSWPVRDAACTACGRCVLAYPEQCREVLPELFALWVAHLWDNIPTVRENSATALGNCVRAYGAEMEERLVGVALELLPMAMQQPEESAKYSELQNTSQFGVVQRKARDNDPEVHTDQGMFSCGSLVQRFSTAALVKSDGCMDYGFARDKQPWEASDGAIYLIRELAAVAPLRVPPLLPPLADLARLRTFQHAFHMHETLWRCLPAIARGVGKKVFKAAMEDLVGAAIADLRCGHQLAEAAAGSCLAALRQLVGPNIFDGRLSPEQLQLMHASLPPPSASPFPPPSATQFPMASTQRPTPSEQHLPTDWRPTLPS